jgi:ribosome-binding factor A
MSHRRERFASTLRHVVANLIQTDLSDPRIRGLVSVSRVVVSPDLHLAKVYVSVMGTTGEQQSSLTGLRHSAGHLQSLLKDHLEFRICPKLDFRLDDELKESMETMALIDELSLELAAKDAEDASEASVPQNEKSPNDTSDKKGETE